MVERRLKILRYEYIYFVVRMVISALRSESESAKKYLSACLNQYWHLGANTTLPARVLWQILSRFKGA